MQFVYPIRSHGIDKSNWIYISGEFERFLFLVLSVIMAFIPILEAIRFIKILIRLS